MEGEDFDFDPYHPDRLADFMSADPADLDEHNEELASPEDKVILNLANALVNGLKPGRKKKPVGYKKPPRVTGVRRNKSYEYIQTKVYLRKCATFRKYGRPWTEPEDELLVESVKDLKSKNKAINDWIWHARETFKGTRTPRECMFRYNLHLEKNFVKGQWSSEEVKCLLAAIQEKGTADWVLVADIANINRSRKTCRNKWLNLVRTAAKLKNCDESEITAKHLLDVIICSKR